MLNWLRGWIAIPGQFTGTSKSCRWPDSRSIPNGWMGKTSGPCWIRSRQRNHDVFPVFGTKCTPLDMMLSMNIAFSRSRRWLSARPLNHAYSPTEAAHPSCDDPPRPIACMNKAVLNLPFSLQIQMEVVSALTLTHKVEPYTIWLQKTRF